MNAQDVGVVKRRNLEALFDQLNELVDASLLQAERAERAEAELKKTLETLAWVMGKGNGPMERATAEKAARALLVKHGVIAPDRGVA